MLAICISYKIRTRYALYSYPPRKVMTPDIMRKQNMYKI